jgi:hypothetical protein
MAKPATPKPVVTAQVCSLCGLPWDGHGEQPTIEKCVELLRAALDDALQLRELVVSAGSYWPSPGSGST